MRRRGAWQSTQENLWALTALEDYRKAQEGQAGAVQVEAYLGDERLGTFALGGSLDVDASIDVPMARIAGRPPGNLAFRVKGQGRVFYSAELDYTSTDLLARPEDHGFSVQRLVRALAPRDLRSAAKGVPRTSATSARLGNLVLVNLLVESAEPRDQVVLVDPLPAGIEAIDSNLDTTSRADQVEPSRSEVTGQKGGWAGYGAAFAEPQGVHREVHDDRVLTFVRHIDPGMYHFRYLARATSVGRFVAPPTEIRCMYAPEASGRTAATVFSIAPSMAALAAR